MKTPHDIESLARQIQFEPDASADERILRAAEAALNNQRESVRVGETRLRRRYGMHLRIAKWAVAAVVVIALIVYFWGGSLDGASVTWADVVNQIRAFRPYRCRYSIEGPDKPPDVRILERLSLTQRRETFLDGSVIVYDLSIPKELVLYPDKKQAHEHWYDFEPKQDFDLLSMVNMVQEAAAKEPGITTLGLSTIEGHTVVGFQGGPMTLWADVHTKLPVRLEGTHKKDGAKLVLDQFEFDVVFDKALFDTTAPADYSVEKTGKGYTDVRHVGEGLPEEPLLTGLKVVAEALDGVFPPEIDLPKLQQTLRQYIAEHKFSEEEKDKWLLPISEYWTRAVWHLNKLANGDHVKGLQWVGGGIRLGDGTTAILWWQYPNSSTYRVIYGDLTIKDLRPEELPK